MIEPPMQIEKQGLDKNLLKKRGNSKTFLGWILARMQDARKQQNFEIAKLLETIYKKGMEFQTSEKIRLTSWKGKSGIKILEHPDKFICITYQKETPNTEPKEIKKEILKTELNNLIVVLNSFKDKNKIPTSAIAEKYYQTGWKKVFSNRIQHTYLVYMLNILEKKEKIKYSRKGFTTINKNLNYFCCK